MVSLSEARPNMVRRVDGWTAAVVRGCLEGMGDIPEEDMEIWLEADVRASSRLCFGCCMLLTEGCSPRTTPRTTRTRTSTSRRSTA